MFYARKLTGMTLTETQKGLVQSSFALAAMDVDRVAETFYRRLFEIAPHTQTLFHSTDMQYQGQKLMQTLATLVGGLDRLDEIVGAILSLGVRHIKYGVHPEDYQAVGQALIRSKGYSMTQLTKLNAAASLVGVDLTDAALTKATMIAANLSDALLRGANMTVANLKGTIFQNARIIGVVGIDLATLQIEQLNKAEPQPQQLTSQTEANTSVCLFSGPAASEHNV
jgi:hemoglobin-like flavoprotein